MSDRPTMRSDLSLVGIEPHEVEALAKQAHDEASAQAATERYHRLLKDRRKAAMRLLHPDLGGDEEQAKRINAAFDRLLRVRITQKPKALPVHTVVIQPMGWRPADVPIGSTSTTGTASATASGWGVWGGVWFGSFPSGMGGS